MLVAEAVEYEDVPVLVEQQQNQQQKKNKVVGEVKMTMHYYSSVLLPLALLNC